MVFMFVFCVVGFWSIRDMHDRKISDFFHFANPPARQDPPDPPVPPKTPKIGVFGTPPKTPPPGGGRRRGATKYLSFARTPPHLISL